MNRSYRDYCRPANPVERSSDTAQPGHFVLARVDRPALRVEGEVASSVVRMKGRG
jgi:hypothetical protein